MVVIMLKVWSGISLFKRVFVEIISVDVNNLLFGMWFLFSFVNLDGFWLFLFKLYKIWFVENILLLQVEVVEVSIIKLIILVVSGILIKLKVLINGFFVVFNFIYGLINKRMISVLIQKNKICSGILLMVDGIFFWGFDVFVVDIFINLILMYVNIIIWNESKKFEILFGNSFL